MEAHTCNHPLVPHTVLYSLGERADVSRPFSDLEGADQFAQKIIRQNSARLKWLKVFRGDNESYTCFYWQRPYEVPVENQKVKLEVDMEPLQSAFDSVATGFKEQGKRIKWLTISQGACLVTVTALVIDRIF